MLKWQLFENFNFFFNRIKGGFYFVLALNRPWLGLPVGQFGRALLLLGLPENQSKVVRVGTRSCFFEF